MIKSGMLTSDELNLKEIIDRHWMGQVSASGSLGCECGIAAKQEVNRVSQNSEP